MKLAVRLPYHAADVTGAGLAAVAVAADQAGMHSGWVADHVVFPAGEVRSRNTTTASGGYPRPMDEVTLESWTALSYAAAVTSRLRLGVGVTVLPYRNPLGFAKTVASLDVLSGGRVICGVGLGWLKEEFDALGVPFDDRRVRSEETVQLLRRCWDSSPVTFDGTVVNVPRPVHFVPRPNRRIPVVFGGHSVPALRRAATMGDGWIGHELMPESVSETRERLDRFATGGALPEAFSFVTSRLMNPPRYDGAEVDRLDISSVAALEDVFEAYDRAGVDILLCEPTVRTIDGHLRLVEQVAEAGRPWTAAVLG